MSRNRKPAQPPARPAPPASGSRTGWRHPSFLISACAIFGLAVLTYANTLGHGFVWDDPFLLDQKARFYRGALDAWFEPPGLPNMRMYRPLEMMSLWIDQRLWWRNGFGFHSTQVLLHAVNGVLVLALARGLGAAPWAALVGAAAFVVHPVQVESVAWLTCRADVLTGTFAAIATLLFLHWQARAAWWTIPAVALAAFLCTASKETGSVTPFLLLAVTWAVPRPSSSFAARLRRAWPALAAASAGVVACNLLRPADVTTGVGRAMLGVQDLLNVMGAFGFQIARVLAPIGFTPYVPTTPTDLWHLFFAIVGGAALLYAIVAPAHDAGRRRLAVLWFLIAVAPAVAVVLADFSTTPVAERRLYLGMIGVALLIAGALTAHATHATTRVGMIATGAVLTIWGATTLTRNAHWHDELTLWSAVTERMQTDAVPYLNLGLALSETNRPADAETAYRRALSLGPNEITRQRASINLGLILVGRGALDEAQQLFDRAIAIGPHAIAYRGLGMVARERAKIAARAGDNATAGAELTKAHDELQRALAINPRYYQARSTLAGVFYDAGRYRDALAQYQQVIAIAADTDAGRSAQGAVADLTAWLAAHPESP